MSNYALFPNTEPPETTVHSPAKLNTDVSVTDDNIWVAGVILSNHNGRRIASDSYALGKGYGSYAAELQVIEDGALFLRRSDIDHAIIFSDCDQAVERACEMGFDQMFDTGRIRAIPRDDNFQAHCQAQRRARLMDS